MTHGREKSDSAIVAGKPTNNVERSTAVPAEPRAEAEGNARNRHSVDGYRKRHGPKPTAAVLPTVEKLAECLLPEDRLSHYFKSYRGGACSVRMRPRLT